MADRHTPEQRRRNMSAVKNKNTKPEMAVRKFLCSRGVRYRVNFQALPCKPDIVITKSKLAIFVHGCFWHGHNCKKGNLPKTNLEFWKNKIDLNKKRDLKNKKDLKELGWKSVCIWECQIGEFTLLKILRDFELLSKEHIGSLKN